MTGINELILAGRGLQPRPKRLISSKIGRVPQFSSIILLVGYLTKLLITKNNAKKRHLPRYGETRFN
jgi:hypothetical protein